MPDPTTTVLSGSSVIFIGIPSSSAIFLSSCFRIDPPPVSQAPSLSISETSAGGVLDSENSYSLNNFIYYWSQSISYI